MSNGQRLSRRKFGAVAGVGGGAMLLSGCTTTIQVIPVRVVTKGSGLYEMEPIDTVVSSNVKKLQFVSMSKLWAFKEQPDTGGDYGAAPRIWTVAENPNDPKVRVKPTQNNMVCETEKIPPSKGKKVHTYFVMTFVGKVTDLSQAEISLLPVNADGTPRTPGDCGGGGDVDGGGF